MLTTGTIYLFRVAAVNHIGDPAEDLRGRTVERKNRSLFGQDTIGGELIHFDLS